MTTLEDFFLAYVECALWSSTDESTPQGGEPFDLNYSMEDISQESLDSMRAECRQFISLYPNHLRDIDASQAGHDFWLTRNHHGAGFWDRGLGAVGDYLTHAAHLTGESDLYLGDDGKIHVSPLKFHHSKERPND